MCCMYNFSAAAGVRGILLPPTAFAGFVTSSYRCNTHRSHVRSVCCIQKNKVVTEAMPGPCVVYIRMKMITEACQVHALCCIHKNESDAASTSILRKDLIGGKV